MAEPAAAPANSPAGGRTFAVKLQRDVPASVSTRSGPRQAPTFPSSPWKPRKLRREKPVKTYVVTVMPPFTDKADKVQTTAPESESGRSLDTSKAEEGDAEQRIAFRSERAQRFRVERAFPVLTSPELLPEFETGSESEQDSPSLTKPTVVALRRVRENSRDRQSRKVQPTMPAWKPTAVAGVHEFRKAPPLIFSSTEEDLQQLPTEKVEEQVSFVKPRVVQPKLTPRHSLMTIQEQESAEKRAKGRRAVTQLDQRLRARVSLKQPTAADFEEKIRQAGEKRRMAMMLANSESFKDSQENVDTQLKTLFKRSSMYA
eukprot:gb/GFBE01031331.1/.p1 GENE.gb/GFBE01031331.1/~~gb/GFBE01031331.1/.p1  ORF type:complete len:316 (+),score=62.15 gb/GFBE01031331.1/:1-948(+)